MANKRIDELTSVVPGNVDVVPTSYATTGPAYKSTVASVVAAGLNQPNSATSGAGANLTIKAADGVTSGAGGSIILQAGSQVTTGGDGVVVVKPANFSGSNTYLRIQNPTTSTYYADFIVSSGTGAHNLSIQGSGTSFYTVNLTCNSFNITGYLQIIGGSYPVVTASGVRLGYSPLLLSASQTYAVLDTVGLLHGSVGTIRVADASGSSVGSGGGSFAYTSSTPTALAINTDNLILTGSAFQRLSASAAVDLTGIAPPTGGAHVDGRSIKLVNIGTNTITLRHQLTSTAPNQLYTSTGASVSLAAGQIANCIYDTAITKWRVWVSA